MKPLAFSMFLTMAALASAQLKLDGTYDVLTLEPGAKKAMGQDPKITPPGQIRHFVVQGSLCSIFDMMSGFQGTWKQKGKEIVITWTMGPSGKMKKPQTLTFLLSKDTKTLTQNSSPQTSRLVFQRISDKPIIKISH